MSRAFDFDPKELELPPEIAAKAKRGAGIVEKPAAPSRKLSGIKRKDAFAIVPLWWARRAAKAGRYVNVMVCVELVYRAWRVRGAERHLSCRIVEAWIAGQKSTPCACSKGRG
jgi:hypothetical protein